MTEPKPTYKIDKDMKQELDEKRGELLAVQSIVREIQGELLYYKYWDDLPDVKDGLQRVIDTIFLAVDDGLTVLVKADKEEE